MQKTFLFLSALFLGILHVQAQYTTTINSNRPGNSQGAFSVGTGVLQLETGLRYGNDEHSLLLTDTDLYGLEFAVRYGLIWEQLELSWMGSFQYADTTVPIGGVDTSYSYSDFDNNTLGAKYLIYDPYKKDDGSQVNIRSWKANRKFSFKKLIPAVSAYAGVNLMLGDNPYKFENEGSISPKFAVATQNNWGPWVFVMNIIADKITEEYPTYAGIFTMTHSVNGKLAFFGEYQAIKSDVYADNIARLGGAYLFSRNFQVDVSGLVNTKDTPTRWQVAAGISYRIDMHDTDVFIEDEAARKKREAEKERMDKMMGF